MTQKHKNSSKWAKRILRRGLDIQDEGTRAAISEQLHQHALLTRKMNSMKENTSSDDSSDEEDDIDISDISDQGRAPKLLEKAKEKTLEVIEEEDEVPKSGVLSLPFMVFLIVILNNACTCSPLVLFMSIRKGIRVRKEHTTLCFLFGQV